jgi:hypothetical protein
MKIKLQNVRLSFPSLYTKASFNGETTKYEATFLIDKAAQKDLVAQIASAIKEKVAVDLKGAKLGADKVCLKDGDDIAYEGYAGCYSIKASNSKRPMTLNRDKSPAAESDDVFYAGCYVNAVVEIWTQNNAYGKRVNASLLGVQFAKHGDPLGGGAGASESDFDDVEGSADDFDEAMGF